METRICPFSSFVGKVLMVKIYECWLLTVRKATRLWCICTSSIAGVRAHNGLFPHQRVLTNLPLQRSNNDDKNIPPFFHKRTPSIWFKSWHSTFPIALFVDVWYACIPVGVWIWWCTECLCGPAWPYNWNKKKMLGHWWSVWPFFKSSLDPK